ncbi:capsular biosynthesis protein [Stutzerimonas stutzeri]|uniref:Capsular biosynthesis protein n=1 Tax=Stutzerimonas stutzeri TaxID=316 RepID=W8QZY5_STUST|nr:polysaccharide biosynthesis/export family protein [Stutzerimonas stutzeri]AHL75919.1 capsular biosynthesis protein [Stutzerimonas stutzeri]MCQ4331291.1 polysaccharide biosynthesis/export family protein [Stutzerimonas stutzeri]
MKPLFALAFSSVLVLQGCVFAPGQYLDPDEFKDGAESEDGTVQLIRITPDMLKGELSSDRGTSSKQELIDYKPEAYRIGANDLLYITVWDHPELTAPSGPQQQLDANGRLVRPDGTLFYPYIGTVNAAGRTIEELRIDIARRLANYIDSPQVDVSLLRYGSQRIVLSGAFNTAGEIPVTTAPMTIVQAISQAGVNTDTADLSGLMLKRGGREYMLNLDDLNRPDSWLHQVYLKDGDQLHLPYNDQKKIYVLGEVTNPQALSFKTTSYNLMDAIGTAGGIRQETADGEAVYVIRGAENIATEQAKVFQLNAQSPTAFALAKSFPLQPQDVVFVGPAGITRWNRFISQLLPSASFVGTGAAFNR